MSSVSCTKVAGVKCGVTKLHFPQTVLEKGLSRKRLHFWKQLVKQRLLKVHPTVIHGDPDSLNDSINHKLRHKLVASNIRLELTIFPRSEIFNGIMDNVKFATYKGLT